MINSCKKCLTLETKNNLLLNKICSACRYFEIRKKINWKKREKEFEKEFQNKSSNYDCIIPVSGGKDSTYQILKALEFNLKSIGIFIDTGHMPDIGKKNFENLKRFNIPIIHLSFEKKLFDRLALIGLEEVGDIEWIEALAVNVAILNLALKFKIKKILWGENSQSEYGGPKKFQESKAMLNKIWFKKFGGTYNLTINNIKKKYSLKSSSFTLLKYPNKKKINSIKSLFLGYFFNWDSFKNYEIAKKNGFKNFKKGLPGTIVDYENIDNYHAGIHDYFRYLKTGMGRAHDQVSRLIRRGKISKKKGLKLINQKDGEFPFEYTGISIEKILKELKLSKKKFMELTKKFTNNKIFNKTLNLKFGERPTKKF